jgi:hypothetical protein
VLDWAAVEDRRGAQSTAWRSDLQAWAAEQMETFMDWRYYHRCYVQRQNVYVEFATEKDALSKIVEDAVWTYCTRVNVVRGRSRRRWSTRWPSGSRKPHIAGRSLSCSSR